MKHVVHFSGGVGSWATAKLAKADMHYFDDLVLLFADTLIEDEDTYRFIEAAAANVGAPLTRIAEGRTPWEVFKDEGFLANTRVDICSRILKRDLLRKWLTDNCDPATTINYIGIDWTEIHRYERAKPRWEPWRLEAPLTETSMTKADLLKWADAEGLPHQRLYEMGMPHANCGGGCVKAGQGHFAKLLREFPQRYVEWETQRTRRKGTPRQRRIHSARPLRWCINTTHVDTATHTVRSQPDGTIRPKRFWRLRLRYRLNKGTTDD